MLANLASSLGTNFNIRLARILRARLALFVEGDDMTLLRELAKKAGARSLAAEDGVAVVPIEGMSNRRRLDSFRWVADELLKGAVKGFVILDRDYMSDGHVTEIRAQLKSAGLHSHVWARKELESYLLSPTAIARISGASVKFVQETLAIATEDAERR